MKFFVFANHNEVKHYAELVHLTDCPINEKDLCSDFFEEIFDGGYFTYHPSKSNCMLGFINEQAMYVQYVGKLIMIHPVLGIYATTEDAVIRRFCDIKNNTNDDAEDQEHIFLAYKDKQTICINSYWIDK